ncbi:hypothetical protein ACKI1H_27995 [Pseudomonas sp. YH-1]|uniref:hypothetical protein n=1 Tax=unclassified Pseudomonas TaxID=196821 RepID=UPI0007EE4A94|nr:hypothetical protein [Pseudomonas sp. AU12215]OBY57290.1 hypothetical protein A9513_026655 [Pseudomonas sp. AU12215]
MSIEQQVRILNSLTQIMHDSAGGNYDEMCCEFEYEAYNGGWSVGSKYKFILGGVTVSELLDDPEDNASGLVHELHELMKSHTGGDWRKFVLSIDPNGKANTKFIY